MPEVYFADKYLCRVTVLAKFRTPQIVWIGQRSASQRGELTSPQNHIATFRLYAVPWRTYFGGLLILMSRRAFTQGLDGLCGLYSLTNSVKKVMRLEEDEACDFFECLCVEMVGFKPSAVVSGLTFPEMLHFKTVVLDYFGSDCIGFTAPFRSKTIRSSEEYFAEIGKRINDKEACAILPLGDPWNHWTVGEYTTDKSVRLIDSSNIGKFGGHDWLRIHKTSTVAEHNKLTLHPRQTIFISAI